MRNTAGVLSQRGYRGEHPKRYSLSLTERELWYLRENYEAAFTDPDSRNPTELSVADKLNRLYMRVSKDRLSASSGTTERT